MSRVLVLTMNILAEKDVQDKLQSLGNEVYCSSKIFSQSLVENDYEKTIENIGRLFDFIVFSDSISEQKFLKYVEIFSSINVILIRKLDEKPITAEIEESDDVKRLRFLYMNMTKDEIRELFTLSETYLLKENGACRKVHFQEIHFSGYEKKLVHLLLENPDIIIRRERICDLIWSDPEKLLRSKMAQISVLRKKINSKVQSFGIPGNLIDTYWGKGYRINQTILEYFADMSEIGVTRMRIDD